ncbi:tail fiber domain-containing protein [Pseudomonas juntendi]|uniref:tail fiber domain-containing protein n=1 Tax=Pseudomonas juntendi TaxID=2666183 RepID=UPI0021B38388|nr:tail fiber domain-containing protein [Pseudomonas juntendi]UXA36941.1 tail fiber domain-containing protein [Pseudomonas juntendi]
MAYNSAHTGPEIDAAVQQLGQIQEARDATNQDRIEVKDLAAQVKVDAGQISSQADIVSAKATQVAANAIAVEQARVQVVGASEAAESAMDAAVLSAASAEESQAAASASEQAAAQSQLAAGLSEQVSAEHAAEATSAATQVATDRAAAQASAASAAASAQNAEAVVTGGTASVTPSPGLIPLADAQGKIDADWLPEEVARTESVEAALEASAEAVNTASEARSRTASFLQPSPEAPAVRDDGSPLQVGDRYFNSVEQSEWIYTEDGWASNDSLAAIDSIKNASDPSKGGREVGYDGANVSDMLDLARPLADYPALRSYSGSAKIVRITKAGIEGFFAKLASGSYVDDNGITIVSATGEAWRRLFVGDIYVVWFEPPTGGVDALAAFNRAAAAAVAAQNGSSSASTPRVVVSEGTYTLSGPTAGSVKWLLLPTGKLTTPSVIPGLDFSCERLSGKVDRRTGSKQFTSMIVGDGAMSANKVLTEIGAPNLFPAEIMGCSSNAAGGIMGSSRTGSRDGFDMASIGVVGLSVNDNTVTLKPAYAGYFEGVRLAGTGNENGIESTIVNMGSVVVDTPNRTRGATDGETYNLVLTSGGAAGSGAQDSTGAILISQKAAGKYDKGIVFKNGSISSNTAIALWENQRITLFGTGDQGVEREGVRYSGFVAANEQGVASIGAWDNPSASWRGITIQSSALSPTNDNVMSVGTPSLRTSVIYSATGSIQTSDERSKVEISDIPDCVLDAWALVKYKTYKLSDSVASKGGDARWHFGITAQSVEEAFESLGLNPFDYGVLCYDSWDDQWEEIPEVTRSVPAIYSEILDSKGQKILVSDARLEIIEPARRELKVAAGDRYGVRYDEAAILSLALLQRTIERCTT